MASAIPCPEDPGGRLEAPEIESETGERRAVGARHAASPSAGDLRGCDFAMLLHRLHVEQASGVLMLQNGKKKKAL